MRNRILIATAFATALIGAVTASPVRVVAAGTPLTLCNQSASSITIAVGYHSSGPNDTPTELTGPFVSNGWWTIRPGQCQALANPFNARYMYWGGYIAGGTFLWTAADRYFCIPHATGAPAVPGFTLEDQNASQLACTGASPFDSYGPNEWIAVREVDVVVNATAYYTGH